MIYNKASPRYIEDAINLVTALIQVNRAANNYNNTNNNIISTVNSLNIPFDIGNSNGNKESDSISSICASKQRWRVIEGLLIIIKTNLQKLYIYFFFYFKIHQCTKIAHWGYCHINPERQIHFYLYYNYLLIKKSKYSLHFYLI